MSRKVSVEEKYQYYMERYSSRNQMSTYSKKINMIQMENNKENPFRKFEMNFNAVREYLKEKGQRPDYKRVIERMVDTQLFAYRTKSAKKQAKFLTQYDPDHPINYKQIMSGEVEVSKEIIKRIYKEKQEEYKALFPDYDFKDAYEYAKDWISENIYGS